MHGDRIEEKRRRKRKGEILYIQPWPSAAAVSHFQIDPPKNDQSCSSIFKMVFEIQQLIKIIFEIKNK